VFTRAQALGAHRRQAHGVAGTSKNAKAHQKAAVSSNGRRRRSRRAPAAAAVERSGATATRLRAGAARRSGDGGAQAVDRDALLRVLFPGGIPPEHDVMVAVTAWLDEAERLASRR
jgi:hypothetical protein